MIKLKQVISAAVSAAMLASLVSCGSDKTETAATQPDVLTYLTIPYRDTDISNAPITAEIEKRLNLDICYTVAKNMSDIDVAMHSDNMPDIVASRWYSDYGGAKQEIGGKLYAEGKLLNIKPYMETKAPNFSKYLSEHPELRKDVLSDKGEIFGFPFISGDKALCVWRGLMIRKDWLDKYGLEMPETIDEWHDVLSVFRDNGVEKPLTLNRDWMFGGNSLMGAWKVNAGMYLYKGELEYGILTDKYRECIQTLAKWYSEGLIDKDIAISNSNTVEEDMLEDKVGAAYGAIGSGIGRWNDKSQNPEIDLVGAPSPTLVKGEVSDFYENDRLVRNWIYSITANCKNLDAAFRLLDYGYDMAEGTMLYNFGIEGESYEMKNGKPEYTELITNNPDGTIMNDMMPQYMYSNHAGAMVQDIRYYEAYTIMPQQKEAWRLWKANPANNEKLPLLYFEEANEKEMVNLDNQISDYIYEMTYKFITGAEPMENYGAFIARLKEMGIDKLYEETKRAYERYLERR